MFAITALTLLIYIQAPGYSIVDLCNQFNDLNSKVRDNSISKGNAQKELKNIIPMIRKAYYENKGKDYSKTEWVFPLHGYHANSIGGIKGNGYILGGYNYFDGNKHTGHPAQDIFINDKNQDCQDDNTKKAVNVLSVTGGIVVATENRWETNSKLRGGIYIWIYNATDNSLMYYAHLKEIFVKPGDFVKPADIIGTVGRTGLNAFAKRSPTHLHISLLVFQDNLPQPLNIYNYLLSCKTK